MNISKGIGSPQPVMNNRNIMGGKHIQCKERITKAVAEARGMLREERNRLGKQSFQSGVSAKLCNCWLIHVKAIHRQGIAWVSRARSRGVY